MFHKQVWLKCDSASSGKLCVWDCGPSVGWKGLREDCYPHSARVFWTWRHKWSSGECYQVNVDAYWQLRWATLLQKLTSTHYLFKKKKQKTDINTTMKSKTSWCPFPFPGAACRAEPGAYAERGALTGCSTGPGGQSQPPRAHFQAAGWPLWACFVPRRHGKVIWQTPQRVAWFGPRHTWGCSGECLETNVCILIPQIATYSVCVFSSYLFLEDMSPN